MFESGLPRCSRAGLVFLALFWTSSLNAVTAANINNKVAQLDTATATLEDVIRIFGEPEKYFWGKETFTKDNLPSTYILDYPNGFSIVVSDGLVSELRHTKHGYVFRGELQVGSSLEEVLDVVGQPTETTIGQPCAYKDGVLYKDIDGKKGYCYYSRRDQRVRFFFMDYKVTALYVTYMTDRSSPITARPAKKASFQAIKPIQSVEEFDDVRWKDLSSLDLSSKPNLIPTLRFNEKTIWPDTEKLPAGYDPNKILTNAMNPGLGVRKLHQQGIKGKGINVAIIDQPLYLDHPEFAGKIVAYHDTGCGTKSSMHGPAVASLLIGTNCGTAPDANVYYAAAPSWTKDTAYQAQALDWIIEQNENLPASEKIRVVSVSAAPSGPGSPFEKNQQMWDRACRRAEATGILVLDCTTHHGFIGKCWYNARVPESVSRCTPGDPKSEYHSTNRLLVPSAPRTTAEEYDKGDCSYQYCGTGGLSWSIPYCAGVLTMGWQIRPELKPEQMRQLLFESAFVKRNGAKIINPQKFIDLVKKAKPGEGRRKTAAPVNQNTFGRWRTVDFVPNIDDFKPGQKNWQGTFYLKNLTFFRDGRTSKVWKWRKGYLWDPVDRTKMRYIIKEIKGSKYLFMEWKDSGSNQTRYYVLKKI